MMMMMMMMMRTTAGAEPLVDSEGHKSEDKTLNNLRFGTKYPK